MLNNETSTQKWASKCNCTDDPLLSHVLLATYVNFHLPEAANTSSTFFFISYHNQLCYISASFNADTAVFCLFVQYDRVACFPYLKTIPVLKIYLFLNPFLKDSSIVYYIKM